MISNYGHVGGMKRNSSAVGSERSRTDLINTEDVISQSRIKVSKANKGSRIRFICLDVSL